MNAKCGRWRRRHSPRGDGAAGEGRYHRFVTLSRVEAADLQGLQQALAGLQASLDERTASLERTRTQLAAFRIRYQHEVGQLHEELDDLLDAIAEAELEIAGNQTEPDRPVVGDGAEDGETTREEAPRHEPAARYTSDAVRKLFRDVAKAIHPDLSRDADARDRRHALMVEANRAYAMGDLAELRRILDAWHGSPDAVTGTGPDAMRERLVRRIAEVEAQIAACDQELSALQEGPLSRLKAMVDEAAANGKDLVADTIRRLERDILAARNRLDAMRWRP